MGSIRMPVVCAGACTCCTARIRLSARERSYSSSSSEDISLPSRSSRAFGDKLIRVIQWHYKTNQNLPHPLLRGRVSPEFGDTEELEAEADREGPDCVTGATLPGGGCGSSVSVLEMSKSGRGLLKRLRCRRELFGEGINQESSSSQSIVIL